MEQTRELRTRKSALQKKIRHYEKIMEGIGNVNLKALEIYETVEDEYNQMSEKRDHLHEVKENILVLMTRVKGKGEKEKLMRELEKVKQELRDVDVRLEEHKIYLDSLRSDAEQAVKFREAKRHLEKFKRRMDEGR